MIYGLNIELKVLTNSHLGARHVDYGLCAIPGGSLDGGVVPNESLKRRINYVSCERKN